MTAKSEASGFFTCHTSPGVPVRSVATTWDRGALSGDVPRLWYGGYQHVTRAFVSPRKRTGKPAPAIGRRNLPLPEADICPPPIEKRCALQRRQGLTARTSLSR